MKNQNIQLTDFFYCPIVRLNFCSDHNSLFTSLANVGLRSKLINHFAECEAYDRQYTDLSNNNILFKKTKQKVKENRASTKSDKSASIKVNTVYKLKEGIRSFQQLLQLDEDYIPNILKGIELGLCKLHRIDISIDLR